MERTSQNVISETNSETFRCRAYYNTYNYKKKYKYIMMQNLI